jgi:hypothetical protein
MNPGRARGSAAIRAITEIACARLATVGKTLRGGTLVRWTICAAPVAAALAGCGGPLHNGLEVPRAVQVNVYGVDARLLGHCDAVLGTSGAVILFPRSDGERHLCAPQPTVPLRVRRQYRLGSTLYLRPPGVVFQRMNSLWTEAMVKAFAAPPNVQTSAPSPGSVWFAGPQPRPDGAGMR